MKVVINKCYGGFSLSDEAIEMYLALKGKKYYKYSSKFQSICGCDFYFCPKEEYEKLKAEHRQKYGDWKKFNELDLYFSLSDVKRNDPDLVKVVQKLKKKANGRFADLKIINIPDDVKWDIDEYDGMEKVVEQHRSWA